MVVFLKLVVVENLGLVVSQHHKQSGHEKVEISRVSRVREGVMKRWGREWSSVPDPSRRFHLAAAPGPRASGEVGAIPRSLPGPSIAARFATP